MSKLQRGASLLVVLVLLTVLAMAALTLARSTSSSSLVAGNMSYKTAAMQVSEAGMSEGFAQLQALAVADLDATKGAWYFPTVLATDASGLPKEAGGFTWSAAPSVAVSGGYSAKYVVERLCTVAPVTDMATQCFVKRLPAAGSAKAGTEAMDAPAVVEYRITVFVQGPKGTQTLVQGMATRQS
jgi:type IV pilus assembly protein PilX